MNTTMKLFPVPVQDAVLFSQVGVIPIMMGTVFITGESARSQPAAPAPAKWI
jgi:hypothetical protein